MHRTAKQESCDSSGGVRPVFCEGWQGSWCPAPSVPRKASLPAPSDSCRAFIVLEHWSEKEHVLILRSRKITVFISKACRFLCRSQISFLCHKVRIVYSSALMYPGLGAVGVVPCFTKGKWKANAITQAVLVYLQHFSSSWFDSNGHLWVRSASSLPFDAE